LLAYAPEIAYAILGTLANLLQIAYANSIAYAPPGESRRINIIAYALKSAYAIFNARALFPTYALSSTDVFLSAVATRLAYAGVGASARTVAYVLEITGIYRIRRIV
jgi:hypothetical protein